MWITMVRPSGCPLVLLPESASRSYRAWRMQHLRGSVGGPITKKGRPSAHLSVRRIDRPLVACLSRLYCMGLYVTAAPMNSRFRRVMLLTVISLGQADSHSL
jgi:hypothetical protein